jgi:hypothetical protein
MYTFRSSCSSTEIPPCSAVNSSHFIDNDDTEDTESRDHDDFDDVVVDDVKEEDNDANAGGGSGGGKEQGFTVAPFSVTAVLPEAAPVRDFFRFLLRAPEFVGEALAMPCCRRAFRNRRFALASQGCSQLDAPAKVGRGRTRKVASTHRLIRCLI